MNRKSLPFVSAVLLLGLVNSAVGDVEIKVDFAYPPNEPNGVPVYPPNEPSDPCAYERWDKTRVKEPGWYIWASSPAWRDLSFHDPQWAAVIRWVDPCDPNVVHQILDPNGISGTGINAKIGVGYQGNTSLKVFGMQWEGDGMEPTGTPKEDPICNSEIISHRHWGAGKTGRDGSIFLSFIGLPPGRYTLKSYHNDLVFLDPYTPDGWGPLEHRFIPDIVVTGEGVVQLQPDSNVPIQQETRDANLIESVVMFETDRHEAEVEYVTWPIGGEYWGSAAVLNAFILQGVPKGTVYNPDPGDGAEDVHPDMILKWRPGEYAQDVNGHNVYLGTDYDGVNHAADPNTPPGRGRVSASEYESPGPLELSTTYYWRIDEVNSVHPNSPWKGKVWSFTVDDGKAYSPRPENGATDVAQDANLSWLPGDYAAWHDVYLGTAAGAVWNTTDPNMLPGRGRQDPCSYDPGGLEFGQTYYWRIDEVNPGYANSKGIVWSFATINYLVIDDMESYDDPCLVPANPITQTWIDGWQNNTGSEVYLEYGSGAAIHSGEQAMWLYYNNDRDDGAENYSEVYANTATGSKNLGFGKNWTESGVKALTLFFYGDPNNAVESMYVALEDTGTPGNIYVSNYGDYGQDPNDITEAEWHHWDIPLEDFNSNGVDITDVNKIHIGLGDPLHPVPGGTGYIYFDDIRLYLPRCLPSITQPESDLTDDCIVDSRDLKMITLDWLDRDYVEVKAPDHNGLLVEYTFDTDYNDTSGNGYHGLPGLEASISEGKLVLNGALLHGAELSYVDIPLGAANPFDGSGDYSIQMTFATTEPNVVLLSSSRVGGTREDHPVMLWLAGPRPDKPLGYYELHIWYTGGSPAPGLIDLRDGMMHSVVTTYDSRARTVYFYTDGYCDGSWPLRYATLYVEQHKVRIGGCASTSFKTEEKVSSFVGEIDSVRVYNYCLSEPEALYLTTGGTGIRPMISPADLYDEELPGLKAVNFRDYATLANTWLEKSYWP